MAGRSDPRHERVDLSLDELCAIARLENSFAKAAYRNGDHAVATVDAPSRLRSRALTTCLRWVRLAPWLVPVGLVIMLVALTSSVIVSALGAFLAGAGLAACARRPWARAPIAHLRGRRVRRRDH